MRRNTATAIVSASVIAAAGGVTGLVIWLSQPSYDDIVNDCIAALEDQPEGDTDKPGACEGVKDDDYVTIRTSVALEKDGWFNEDGSVNQDKLIDPDGE